MYIAQHVSVANVNITEILKKLKKYRVGEGKLAIKLTLNCKNTAYILKRPF